MKESKALPSYEITAKFRDGLFIILDEITWDIYRIGGGEHPEFGIDSGWFESPWVYFARYLGEKYGDYSLYEASKCVGDVQNQVIDWIGLRSSDELISIIELFITSTSKHMEVNKQHYGLNIITIILAA